MLGVSHLRDVPYAGLDEALERLEDETVRRYVRHIVSDDHRVVRIAELLAGGDVRAVGPLLTEGHASLREDLRVSCDELDLVVESAVAAGALGARMTGGGFGGSAIVLVESSAADTVTKSSRRLRGERARLAPGLPGGPSRGAHRLA